MNLLNETVLRCGAKITGNCPVCASTASRVVGSRDKLRLVRCEQCTLVYSHPQPVEEVRKKYLEQLDLAAHFEPWAARKRVLYERHLRDIPAPTPGHDRIVDVGCADGQFLALAAEHGWKTFGIEMNPPAAAKTRQRRATVYQGMLEQIPDLPWGTFDVVTSWDSLEHTPTPREFASCLARLIAPGGRLVMTTLHHRSLAWLALRMNWSMVAEGHFTYWNRKSLARLFEEQGLEMRGYRVYGLGRDFVRFVDALRPRRATSTPGQLGAPEASQTPQRWDVRPSTLVAEDAVNHLLNWFELGVGLQASFIRRP
jgi:2-polyprenyl-3-methyl-5-hydroxy-6-metoxy-1,4-benzoquinol methylase